MGNKIKPMTAKLVVLGVAVLAFLLGLGRFNEWINNELAGSVLTTIFGLALLTEVGLKKITKISNLKKLNTLGQISVALGMFLFVIGTLGIAGVTIASLAGVQGFFLMAGGAFIAIQAFY